MNRFEECEHKWYMALDPGFMDITCFECGSLLDRVDPGYKNRYSYFGPVVLTKQEEPAIAGVHVDEWYWDIS